MGMVFVPSGTQKRQGDMGKEERAMLAILKLEKSNDRDF